jgi:hypothetical protein
VVAIGGAIVVLILLFLLIKGCRDRAKDSAFRDYASEVEALINDSNAESKAMFQALSTTPRNADQLDVTDQLNTQRADAVQLVSRAKGTDHPGELDGAHSLVVQTLEFRADAIEKIAEAIPAATGTRNRRDAIDLIAGEMEALHASDVIYLKRAVPNLQAAYQEQGISAQFPTARFLPSLNWMDPKFVQGELDKISGEAPDQAATPGAHGTGLGAVSVNGTELTDGDVNRVATGGKPPSFEVQVENQGESEETNLRVSVTVAGQKDVTVDQTIPRIAAGDTATVTIPLGQPPPTDGSSEVTIEVAAVPGEETRENNEATYQVAFTR